MTSFVDGLISMDLELFEKPKNVMDKDVLFDSFAGQKAVISLVEL